jgi:ribosomal protein L37AE/L43A
MAILKYILEKLLIPLMISTPVVTVLISKIKTGNSLEYLQSVSKEQWMIIGGVALLLFTVRWIFMKVIAVRKLNDSSLPFAMISSPPYGWKEIGEIEYKGVVWKIKLAVRSIRSENIRLSDIEVGTPPRCPKCKTEIEQKHVLFGRYLWYCINCSFKKRSGESYYIEADRAEKIARRKVEEEFEKRNIQ